MNQRDDFDKNAYNPQFNRSFLHPKYWGTWLAVLLASVFSFAPTSLRHGLAKQLAKFALKIKTKPIGGLALT